MSLCEGSEPTEGLLIFSGLVFEVFENSSRATQVIGLGSKGGRGFILSACGLHKPKQLSSPNRQFFNVHPIVQDLYKNPSATTQIRMNIKNHIP